VGALLVSSGQATETIALLNIAEAGDHIVSSPSLYGGTDNLFHYTLPKLGITVSLVDNPDDPASWRAAVRPNTKAFFGETSAMVVVDNTVAMLYMIRPIEWGADVVVHSATNPIPAITAWSMPGVPLSQQEQITALAPGAHDLQIIRNLHGHDGFLVESDQLGAIVRDAPGICAPPVSQP
jgi:hypothetical protein